jgi:hypothetical protein
MTNEQRRLIHKMANIIGAMPKAMYGKGQGWGTGHLDDGNELAVTNTASGLVVR